MVTTRRNSEAEAIVKARREHAEKPQIQRETEPSPISLQKVALLAQGRETDAAEKTAYIAHPQQKKETKMVSLGAVSGLVRRLMATERARILGRKAIDLGRYALEKRMQRWKEARKSLK